MDSATSSGRTNWLAPWNPADVGRSLLTDHPPPNHRNWACARSIATFSSGSQQIGICPTALAPCPIRGAPSVAFHVVTSSASCGTVIVAGKPDDEGETTSVPDSLIKLYEL